MLLVLPARHISSISKQEGRPFFFWHSLQRIGVIGRRLVWKSSYIRSKTADVLAVVGERVRHFRCHFRRCVAFPKRTSVFVFVKWVPLSRYRDKAMHNLVSG